MHELSLALNMREIIEDQAKKEGFTSVSSVTLEVGKLSHVEADAMRFCFSSAMAGSCAEHATLHITQTEGLGFCQSCLKTSRLTQLYDPCEFCGAFGLEVTEGNDIKIKQIAVS